MADKETIKRHLALTSKIQFDVVPPPKGDEPRKMKIMEHIKKSLG
jgi:hypothetical protein